MQTLSKRAIASRANGAKSQGPKTPAGKRRSSANSLRHGLLAQIVVLSTESVTTFSQFFDEHVQKFNPADGVEYAAVEEMASAAWRLRRALNIEVSLFNKAIVRSTETDGGARLADAFTNIGGTNQLQLLDRYETRLHRMYQRAVNNLLVLRQIPEEDPFPEPNEPVIGPNDAPVRPAAHFAGELETELPNEPETELPSEPETDLPNEPNPDPAVPTQDAVTAVSPNEPKTTEPAQNNRLVLIRNLDTPGQGADRITRCK